MNIKNIITNLQSVFSEVVIPSVNPVVPKALQDSKYASKNETFFRLVTIIIDEIIRLLEK